MANRVWQVSLGLVFLAAVATNHGGCSGPGSSNNCDGVANSCSETSATRCNGTNSGIQTCLANLDGCLVWTDSTSCGDNAVCDDAIDPPTCVCEDECVSAGDSACVGDVINNCLADEVGCLYRVAGTDCAAAGESCDDSAEPAVCVAGCGDGTCDAEGGETPANCPQDCDQPCAARVDCLALEWDAGCEGRWDCVEKACVEVCDYISCGDGVCSAAEGENE